MPGVAEVNESGRVRFLPGRELSACRREGSERTTAPRMLSRGRSPTSCSRGRGSPLSSLDSEKGSWRLQRVREAFPRVRLLSELGSWLPLLSDPGQAYLTSLSPSFSSL